MTGRRDRSANTTGSGARPVLDPGLPPRVARVLRKRSSDLFPKPAVPSLPWFPARTRVLVGGILVAALCAIWTLGSGPLVAWSAPSYFLGLLAQATVVGTAGFALTRGRSRSLMPGWLTTKAGFRWWKILSLGFVPATMASWFLSLQESGWIFAIGWHVPSAVYAASALWVGWWWPRHERLAAAHADRCLSPDSLGRYGTDLILRVQMTIDAVEEAGRRLGDSFDAARPLAILRAEEWQIASILHQHDRIREEHRADSRNAASDRVRALLNRQHERQEAAYRELAARVDGIRDYGIAVEEALNAHTEWEQLERVDERSGRITDLLARTASDGGNGEQLQDEALDARAAKEARDELIDRALEAGRFLETTGSAPA